MTTEQRSIVMANTTKQALEQSLKKLMQVKALDKITELEQRGMI